VFTLAEKGKSGFLSRNLATLFRWEEEREAFPLETSAGGCSSRSGMSPSVQGFSC
jgi:hypothetical protein